MKKLRRSKTLWYALLLPILGWLVQWKNGGTLPIDLQTYGPLLIAVGIILLRLTTGEPTCRAFERRGR